MPEPDRSAGWRIWASLSRPGGTRTPDRLLVREQPSPLGHRTMLLRDSRGLAPRSPTCDASIFLLDDEPALTERKPRDSNSQVAIATGCFQNSVLIQPDDFRPLSCGSWNRTNGLLRPTYRSVPGVRRHYQQQLFRIVFVRLCSTTLTLTHGSLKAAGVGIEPTPPGSKPGITTSSNYPASLRVLCGSRTRLTRLEAWSLCRSAKSTLFSAEGEGVEPSRL